MTEEAKTAIRPNTENYTTAKAASGSRSMHNGDPVAQALEGATLDEVVTVGARLLTDKEGKKLTQDAVREKYAHLNVGQQRMNIGNRIRGAVARMNKAEEGSGDAALEAAAKSVRTAVEKRAAAAAKEAAKKEKDAKAA